MLQALNDFVYSPKARSVATQLGLWDKRVKTYKSFHTPQLSVGVYKRIGEAHCSNENVKMLWALR